MSEPIIFTAAVELAGDRPGPTLLQGGERRVKGEEVVCPICVGTVAWWQGKKAQDALTHKWTLYVRGAHGQDLSYCIKKIAFLLHNSFAEPRRELVEQPFELSEMGWGEFEIAVQLEFQDDVHEKNVEIIHRLKLFNDGEGQATSKKPVISESYDELVFVEPAEGFWRRVVDSGGNIPPAPPLSVLPNLPTWNPQEDLKRFHDAEQRLTMMARC